MTRPLLTVDASDPRAVYAALRDALAGDGPAVLPRRTEGAETDADAATPASVPRGVALVVETSGSTGVPKRVALGTDALLASAAASASAIAGHAVHGDQPGTSQWLLALPAHYVAGVNVLVRSIAAGTEPVILPAAHFDAAAFCHACDELDADVRLTALVPVQLTRLLDRADSFPQHERDHTLQVLRRFDAILVGGQALQPDLRERAMDAGLHIVRTYGSSETAGGCVYEGVPLSGVRARTVEGHLELTGAVLAEGYLAPDGTLDRVRTDAAFRSDAGLRWYRTGDLGTVDGNGRVAVTGRADNVIISGGEKVSLDAVEAVVRRSPGLAEAVVVAVPSEEWGQSSAVVVAGRPSTSLTQLRHVLHAELGRAAAPASLIEVDTVPLLASGKPDRVALARLAAERVSGH